MVVKLTSSHLEDERGCLFHFERRCELSGMCSVVLCGGRFASFLAMQITVGRQYCLTSVYCIYFAVFHLVVLLIKSHFFKKNGLLLLLFIIYTIQMRPNDKTNNNRINELITV